MTSDADRSSNGRRRSALATIHVAVGQCRAARSTARTDEVDADAEDRVPLDHRPKRFAGPAPEIDDDAAGRERCRVRSDAVDEGAPEAGGEQPLTCVNGSGHVSGVARSAILRLQQVDVSRPGDVVGVARVAYEGAVSPIETAAAAADGAREG